MKALEKIVEAKENMNIGYIEWANDCIDEAIAELEALQSRSCEWCKNLVETGKSFKHCDELAINISHMDLGSFCCNRYEAKEQL